MYQIAEPIQSIEDISNTEYETFEIHIPFTSDSYFLSLNVETGEAGIPIKVFIDDVHIQVVNREGIENSADVNQSIHIYPNPATDVINVILPDNFNKENATIVISDMIGKTVKSEKYQSTMNVSELSAEVYTIVVTDGVNKQNRIFIKN